MEPVSTLVIFSIMGRSVTKLQAKLVLILGHLVQNLYLEQAREEVDIIYGKVLNNVSTAE